MSDETKSRVSLAKLVADAHITVLQRNGKVGKLTHDEKPLHEELNAEVARILEGTGWEGFWHMTPAKEMRFTVRKINKGRR